MPPTLPPAAVAGAAGEPDEFPGLERAIQSLIDRNLLNPEDFYSLSATAKQQAFTISGGLTDSTIEKIRQLVVEDVEGPANRQAFVKAAREAFQALPISDSHLEHVYRNAANEAYAQGQEHVLENPLVADGFPYRAYFAIHDLPRVRVDHLALEKLGLNGTNVYHKDDPTWRRFRPPWDWQCRCGFAPLSIRDAAKLGVIEAQQWLESGIEPVHVWVTPPDFSPSPSWDRLEHSH